MWDTIFMRYEVFLMVFARVSGMILFNPVFGKRNIPSIIKVGLSFLISLIVTSTLSNVKINFAGIPDFMFACTKELLIGFAVSFIFQMFLSTVLIAGEIVDLQLGVGMSKVYDPQSNVSMPVSGSIFNLFYMLLFFAGNCHLTFIKIMALSFQILPPGPALLSFDFGNYIVLLFGNILILAVKLSLPIVAIELVVEIGLGVLMRTVPQINVFVIGLPIKLLLGLFLIILVLPNIANLFDSIMTTMFDNIEHSIKMMA
jgi:flagellar biosynthetic protein FliR